MIEISTQMIVISLWDLLWKGFALWRSALRKEKYWFAFLLVLNTAGILPIIYLFITGDALKASRVRKKRAARKRAPRRKK